MRAPSAGCSLISSNSSGGQGGGLAQHVVADADLADVVEEGAEPQHVQLLGRQLHVLAYRHRDRADALRVAGRVGIPRVERQRKGTDGADIRALRLGFRGRHAHHHRVEGVRQRVDLEAGPARAERRVEVPRLRHVAQRPRQRVDRPRQRPGRPHADEARDSEGRDRQPDHRVQRSGQRRARPRRRSSRACRPRQSPTA